MRRIVLGAVTIAALLAGFVGSNPAPAAPITFTVTSADDSGTGTLRAAIELANGNPGRDTIDFAIAAGGPVKTISLQSQLPTISEDVIIDGTTQGDSSCAPRNLRIRVVAGVAMQIGFWVSPSVNAGGTVIRGIETGGQFSLAHVMFSMGSGHSLECSNIGTGNNGTSDDSVSATGVYVEPGASNVTVGGSTAGDGNIVSGNGAGIYLLQASQVSILGNIVGLDRTGTMAIPNVSDGVRIMASTATTIGGLGANDGNVISGNGSDGISLEPLNNLSDPDFPTTGVTILGNRIGTSADGMSDIGNGFNGIRAAMVSDLTIGGATSAARNIISGNSSSGISLSTLIGPNLPPGDNTSIRGNYVGLAADGLTAVPNSNGISASSGTNVVIGGIGPGEGNVASGNSFSGISLEKGSAEVFADGQVIGNRVGTSADGMTAVPNKGYGIDVANGPGHSVLGNLVSGNSFDGIRIETTTSPAATNITVQGNVVGYAIDAETPMSNGSHAISSLISFPGGFGQDQNIIGGVGPGEANRVFSAIPGVRAIYLGSGTTRTTVRGNGLVVREGQALDLFISADSPRGYTPNGVVNGPNGLLHTPILTLAAAGSPGQVGGNLTGVAPSSAYAIDFYRSRTCNDLTRNAETYLGSVVANSNGQGDATFLANPGDLATGDLVTATATGPDGSTSELSPVLVATGLPGPTDLKIIPCERTAGWEDFAIRAFAPAFVEANNPTITWDGVPLATTFISTTEIQATVPAATLGRLRGTASIVILENDEPSNTLTAATFAIPRSSSDTDCDGQVLMLDALRTRTVVGGLATNTGPCTANADRKLSWISAPNATDALWILKELAGLVPDPLLSTNP